MGFKIQGSDGILQKLTNWVANQTEKITDFNPGSAIRTLLESVALQLEEFYYDLKQAVRYAIRNSAYVAFGFDRTDATIAKGHVTIYFYKPLGDDMIIPQGTKFHTGDRLNRRIYFSSTENFYIKAGSISATIPLICDEIGKIGNVGPGDINKLVIGNPRVKYVQNKESFYGGRDRETEIQREVRFREYVHTLQKGTRAAVAYGIKEVPGVAGVYVDDRYIGVVFTYVHDADGNLPSELKEEILNKIKDYRSAGIEVAIKPIVKVPINLHINIKYKDGFDPNVYDVIIHSLVVNYIKSLQASDNVNMSNVVTVINDTYRDIIEYINICENEDIEIKKNQLARPGNISINNFDPSKIELEVDYD